MSNGRRKGAPALYELIDRERYSAPQRGVRPTVVPDQSGDGDEGFAGEAVGGLEAGRSVRVPAGTLFFFVAAIAGALIAGYLIGYQQKSNEVDRLAAQRAAENALIPSDPLQRVPENRELVQERTMPAPEPGPRLQGPDNNRDSAAQNRTQAPPHTTPGPGAWRPTIVENGARDPRERGLNYLALTQVGADGVEPFLAYLFERGVDAIAVRVNNGLYRVFVLEGFTGPQYRAGEQRPLQENVRRLTEAYRDPDDRTVKYDPFWERF